MKLGHFKQKFSHLISQFDSELGHSWSQEIQICSKSIESSFQSETFGVVRISVDANKKLFSFRLIHFIKKSDFSSWSSLGEVDEGSYRRNSQTILVMVRHHPSQLFCNVINTMAYYFGQYELSSPSTKDLLRMTVLVCYSLF